MQSDKGDQVDGVFLKFLQTTDLRGVPRIVKSSHPITRGLWLVAVAACLVLMLYQTVTLLVNYYDNDVTTHFEENQIKPEFPDVTLCNINPYNAFEKFQETYGEYVAKVDQLKKAYEVAHPDSSLRDARIDVVWSELRSKRGYIANNPRFQKRGYTAEDNFIVGRLWYDWQYYSDAHVAPLDSEVTVSWNQKYYSCYTITSEKTIDVFGISVILYIGDFPPTAKEHFNFYLSSVMTSGVRLVIHPKGVQPYLDDGISLSPGTETTIYVSQTNITRLPKPYGNCTNEALLDPSNPSGSLLYSRSACQSFNRQVNGYILQCHCLVCYELYTDSMSDIPFCSNLTSYEPNQFTNSTVDDIVKGPICDATVWPPSDSFDCKLPCSESSYGMSMSQVAWPSLTSQLEFFESYIQNNPTVYGQKFKAYQDILDRMKNMSTVETLRKLSELDLIGQNFLQLNIRLDREIVNIDTQKPSITWDTMMANVGGTLHFWLGITVLVIAEFAEVVFEEILEVYRKKNVSPKNTTKSTISAWMISKSQKLK